MRSILLATAALVAVGLYLERRRGAAQAAQQAATVPADDPMVWITEWGKNA